MGNCLDVPEPKSRRSQANHRRQKVPVLIAPPPEVVPVAPGEYYPSFTQSQFYQYGAGSQYISESQYMPRSSPASLAIMRDPYTGLEYVVPDLHSKGHVNHSYYHDDKHKDKKVITGMDVYVSSVPVPNGIINAKGNQPFQDVKVDEVHMVLRQETKEEQKISEGHGKGKFNITNMTTFAAPERQNINESTNSSNIFGTPLLSDSTPLARVFNEQAAVEETFEQNHTAVPEEDSGNIETTDYKLKRPSSAVRFDEAPDEIIERIEVFDEIEDIAIKQQELSKREPMTCVPKDENYVTSQGVDPTIFFSKPSLSVDVVITYSILAFMESDIVRRLTGLLETSNISVWAERLGDSSKARKSVVTAKAILRAKVVVVILSEGSCHQRFIRDHVALATIINNPIFPVTTQQAHEVLDAMPIELRLQLPNKAEEWTELGTGNEDSFLFKLRSLARSLQDEVEFQREKEKSEQPKRMHSGLRHRHSSTHDFKAAAFWDVHFGHRHSVKWERMQKTLEEEYYDHFKSIVDASSQPVLFEGLKRKACEHGSDLVTKDEFTALCIYDGENTNVWQTILRVARLEQAVRDIFDTESTVRHLVFKNTGEMM